MLYDITCCDSDGFYLTTGEHKVKLSSGKKAL